MVKSKMELHGDGVYSVLNLDKEFNLHQEWIGREKIFRCGGVGAMKTKYWSWWYPIFSP